MASKAEENEKILNSHKNLDIRVIGVGGGGNNAVKNMIQERVKGVHFIVINTDVQALKSVPTKNRLVIGSRLTRGLGAGSNPQVGDKAAHESADQIKEAIEGANMLFITAGMGGGTGTGAAPVVAKIAKSLNILTVGIVTKPFAFEGTKRMKNAIDGIKKFKHNVDTMIVVKNNNLFQIIKRKTSLLDAFRTADDVLREGIQGISGLLTTPGYVNLDFADVTTVMKHQGNALMGIGTASGQDRVKTATKKAISSPLLEAPITNAKQVLLNITGGSDLSLYETQQASDIINKATVNDVNIVFGTSINDKLKGKIRVTVVATGIDQPKHMARDGNGNIEGDKIPNNRPHVHQAPHKAKKSMNGFNFNFNHKNNNTQEDIKKRTQHLKLHLPDWNKAY